jgi:hypothetical protein
MASLKPKLFCGVAFRTKGRLTLQAGMRWNNLAAGRDACNYATILVKRLFLINQSGNASTPTEPTRRCTSLPDCESETANYKGHCFNCQATDSRGVVRVRERRSLQNSGHARSLKTSIPKSTRFRPPNRQALGPEGFRQQPSLA